MTTLEKIKAKVTHIDIEELIKRLELELKIQNDDKTKNSAQTLLEYAIYDTLSLILDVTHLRKIDDSLYSIWVSMIKDYWYLNKYDELINQSEEDDDNNLEVSSIKEGDTQVNFSSTSSTININGTKYSTGSISFDINILKEKYKKDLYRHRKFRWD
jgi:hypothetical protein